MASDQERINIARIYRPLLLDGWYEPLKERAMELAGETLAFIDDEDIGFDLICATELDYHKKILELGHITATQAGVEAIAAGNIVVDLLDISSKVEDDQAFLTVSLDSNATKLGGERKQVGAHINDRLGRKLRWRGFDSDIKVAKMSVARPPQGLPNKLMNLAPERVTLLPAKIVPAET